MGDSLVVPITVLRQSSDWVSNLTMGPTIPVFVAAIGQLELGEGQTIGSRLRMLTPRCFLSYVVDPSLESDQNPYVLVGAFPEFDFGGLNAAGEDLKRDLWIAKKAFQSQANLSLVNERLAWVRVVNTNSRALVAVDHGLLVYFNRGDVVPGGPVQTLEPFLRKQHELSADNDWARAEGELSNQAQRSLRPR